MSIVGFILGDEVGELGEDVAFDVGVGVFLNEKRSRCVTAKEVGEAGHDAVSRTRAEPGADVATWLSRHGVKVTVQCDVAADADVGKWCQGIAWSKDSRTILAQCMVEEEIIAFRFSGVTGKALTRAGVIKTKGGKARRIERQGHGRLVRIGRDETTVLVDDSNHAFAQQKQAGAEVFVWLRHSEQDKGWASYLAEQYFP